MEENVVNETSPRGTADVLNECNGGNIINYDRESPDNNSKEIDPIHDIIDYLVHNDKICFKSQQIGESDLRMIEKRQIASDLYAKGKTIFLTKFGSYLTLQQLTFIEHVKNDKPQDDYELTFIINQLKTMLSEKTRKTIVKNRRFEALQEMIKDNSNSYFSEIEMMQRNPLLYEQLIGQYLSEDEKRDRDNIDTVNITLLNVLIEGIDRDRIKTVLKEQRAVEDCQMEENSSDDETSCEEDIREKCTSSKWGEFNFAEEEKATPKVKPKPKGVERKFITATERKLLREEFVQEMYRSFLAGEDEEFNYFPIDNSADYDCVELRGRDEEEKYFDSESPIEMVQCEANGDVSEDREPVIVKQADKKSESDDELDVFMVHLNRHPALDQLVQK